MRIQCLFRDCLAAALIWLHLAVRDAENLTIVLSESRMPELELEKHIIPNNDFVARAFFVLEAGTRWPRAKIATACRIEMELDAKNDRLSANMGDERAINSPTISPESSFLSRYAACVPRNSHEDRIKHCLWRSVVVACFLRMGYEIQERTKCYTIWFIFNAFVFITKLIEYNYRRTN